MLNWQGEWDAYPEGKWICESLMSNEWQETGAHTMFVCDITEGMWKSCLLQPGLIRNMSQSWRSFTQTPLESVNIPPAPRRFTADRVTGNVSECCCILDGDESDTFICPFLFSTQQKNQPQITHIHKAKTFLNVTEDIVSTEYWWQHMPCTWLWPLLILYNRVTTSHKVEDMQGYNTVDQRLWISIKLKTRETLKRCL